MENSVRKRLSLQNEVLKWLSDLSENIQKRAQTTIVEVNDLSHQADTAERDLKNTLNTLRNLSYSRYLDNRISEEDYLSNNVNKDGKKSAQLDIPAQSYEADILPRYKEAISLGLHSYQNHMQKMNKKSSTGSVINAGLARGPLPHIIGSEEYIHDNSCGLAEGLLLERESLDFGSLLETKALSSDLGRVVPNAMPGVDLFGEEPGTSERKENEPFVSAALDFKAMLEAALLSPYKYYDEETSSLSGSTLACIDNKKQIPADMDCSASTALDAVEVAMGTSLPSTSGNLPSVQDVEVHAQKICAALTSQSLFDTEEEFPSSSTHESHEVPSTEDNSVRNGDEEERANERSHV